MTEVVPSPTIRVVTASKQGPAGPPGAVGPSPAGKSGVFIKTPEAETIPVCASSADAFTIRGIRGLRVESGSLTLSVRINNVPVTGLSDLLVTTTPQDPVATAANAVVEGDRVTLVIAAVSEASRLEFTVY
ncbi:hypothetical protein GobsT_50720 [Gemmata obscuriglobus]|uniref:Collagen-like protein n=1 Tax=Gemmata obscuriglobus TaxID=114 RepID=A0A2Z3H0A8_9BACT|nr:hypothetical protein [Gemmata obscuriglobus]AWM37026.1 hypothetical protein C1280_08335 [Gemmata obscuriglobus]QEG30268.1 hypothetical protein GobsT_50720 [Gemmata obscuriglobus]VTS09592.1 unnamed protein product [Gemmata obscuriglobus UQM 2246]